MQARAAWRWARNFYPRPPRGGRRIVQPFRSKPFGFLSTPSARRATTYRKEQPSALTISIHALREEGDRLDTISNISRTHFYPRPPRGGRRTCGRHGQSLRHFYPRPPRGGRRPEQHYHFALEKFLSTPSARRATLSVLCSHFGCADFYPRPPRGGRPCVRLIRRRAKIFLSTPSARRATSTSMLFAAAFFLFLSTPSARRATCAITCVRVHVNIFLSTPSARRATAKTETKSLFSYKLYNILHEFRRALIYNGSKNDPNHAKRHKNPVRRCRKNAENSPFAPGRETQNNSRPSCSKGG